MNKLEECKLLLKQSKAIDKAFEEAETLTADS